MIEWSEGQWIDPPPPDTGLGPPVLVPVHDFIQREMSGRNSAESRIEGVRYYLCFN